MIPEGWEKIPLVRLAVIQTGVAKGNGKVNTPVLLPYLRVANVQDGHLDLTEVKYIRIDESKIERYSLQYGDVLLTEGGDFDKLGRGCMWRSEIEGCLHQNHVFAVRTDVEKLLPQFFSYQTASNYGKSYFLACSKQSTNLASINSRQLKGFPVLLPPIEEQAAITEVLSTWDRAIEKTEALIEAKERRKAGLMQRLLTGKVRFGEFAGETWKEMSIGKLLRQVKRPVVWDDDASYKLLSLRRASGGLFHRQTLRGSEILTKKMNTALEGDFLISKMQVVHGATGLTTAEFDGYHVSDSYLSYVARDPSTLDIRFFNWLCKTKEMCHKAYRSSYGVHIEKMTFNPKLWLKETIMLPPTTEEQAKIVEVLDTSVAEIEEHRTQLAALKEQKKGLMQQLLTGKVRVKVS